MGRLLLNTSLLFILHLLHISLFPKYLNSLITASPRRLSVFVLEMKKFSFPFLPETENAPHVSCNASHSGFLTKMAAPLATQIHADVLVWLCAHQNTSNFYPHRPPKKKKKRKKKAQLNLLFISILLACGDNFPHREIRTQWRAWLSRRLLLAREITPCVRCIVWMAAMAEFGLRSFLAPLCKLTLSRLPSVAVYHQRSVWPRCPPAFYASLSIWCFSCLFGLFRKIYLSKLMPYIIIMFNSWLCSP